MRTIVDLPEDQVQALDLIGEKESLSRAELVRRAVASYLEHEAASQKDKLDQYFGMLKGRTDLWDGLDGVAWQKKMRAEWDKREADMDRRIAESRGLNDKGQEPYKDK